MFERGLAVLAPVGPFVDPTSFVSADRVAPARDEGALDTVLRVGDVIAGAARPEGACAIWAGSASPVDAETAGAEFNPAGACV